jgi:hypothetical protein
VYFPLCVGAVSVLDSPYVSAIVGRLAPDGFRDSA